jgi:hypothetical protein
MNHLKKKIIIALIILNVLFSTGMSFAFWASSIASGGSDSDGEITVGAWGIPIFNAAEFYAFATKTDSLATDKYYLARDIDFTGFPWVYGAANYNLTFRGELNGNNKTLANLTISNVSTSTSYAYHGIFPRISGARIHDLTLSNVRMVINPTTGTTKRAGIISGNAYGGTNVIENIKIINSSVQGSSSNGVGGLIGDVTGTTTVVTINRIKLSNMRVFSRSQNVGGLVGRIGSSGATVNISDIDFEGDVYSNSTSTTTGAIAGGVIGYTIAGTKVNITRAIVEVTFQNTLVANVNYLTFGTRYLGGFIGYNLSASSNINIAYSFMTGSLYTRSNDITYVRDVGTVTGRTGVNATLDNVYHSFVLYRTNTGTSYTVTDQLGQMATVVNASAMPDEAWWDSAYSIFSAINNYWSQDPTTGRVYLDDTVSFGNEGIAISTVEEFYTFATNVNSFESDIYYLENDLDFTGYTWVYRDEVIFRGTLNGNNKTISNLTINNTGTTSLYLGLFPRMDGGTVQDLTFDNVQMVTYLPGTSQRAGLIAGQVYNGKIATIKNITITDSGVQGTSSSGVGGLVGYVLTNYTTLNIENIKATNFKVFNKSAYVGGLVGRLANISTVNINDVDFEGQVYSHTSSGYSGGLIGYTPSGTFANINRAILELEFINTLVTDVTYFNRYSDRYIGGFIGYNTAVSANIKINDSFFTGSLYNQTNTYWSANGTLMGRLGTAVTAVNTFHSNVAFRNSTGVLVYVQTGHVGQMATLVNASSMPAEVWWDLFYTDYYDAVNDLWGQDGSGRPYLIRTP